MGILNEYRFPTLQGQFVPKNTLCNALGWIPQGQTLSEGFVRR